MAIKRGSQGFTTPSKSNPESVFRNLSKSISLFEFFTKDVADCNHFLLFLEWEAALSLLGEHRSFSIGEAWVVEQGALEVAGDSWISSQLELDLVVWHQLIKLVLEGGAVGSVASSSAVLDFHEAGRFSCLSDDFKVAAAEHF